MCPLPSPDSHAHLCLCLLSSRLETFLSSLPGGPCRLSLGVEQWLSVQVLKLTGCWPGLPSPSLGFLICRMSSEDAPASGNSEGYKPWFGKGMAGELGSLSALSPHLHSLSQLGAGTEVLTLFSLPSWALSLAWPPSIPFPHIP